MCLFGVLLVAGVVVLVRQPQNCTPLPFKVPCVPAIPLVSLFVNIVLVLKLSPMTWVRFVVWMVIGKQSSPTPRKYVFDVTSIGQRSSPWTCNPVRKV